MLKPSRKFCGKPTEIYPTRYPELFVRILDGGFLLERGYKLASKSKLKPYDPNLVPYQNSDSLVVIRT